MYCINCGKKVSAGANYCPKCGGSVSANAPEKTGKKLPTLKKRLLFILTQIVIAFAGIYFIQGSNETARSKNLFIGIIAIALGYSLVMSLIALLIDYVFKLTSKKRIIALLTSSVVLLLVILIGAPMLNRNLAYKEFPKFLPQIQSSLAEAAAAKIMGDSITAKNPMMMSVRASLQLVANQLDLLTKTGTLPSTLTSYYNSTMAWINSIMSAANDDKKWKELADQPEDFNLTLTDGQAQELLRESINKIIKLEEFGDVAVAKNDADTMRFISAKLLVQEHWIREIAYSEKPGLFSSDFTNTAWAANEISVPTVGSGCQIDKTGKCIEKSTGQTQPQAPTQTAQPSTGAGVQSGSVAPTNVTPSTQQSSLGGINMGGPLRPTLFKEGKVIRDVCTTQTPGVASFYCAEGAANAAHDLRTAAENFAKGKKGAKTEWGDAEKNNKNNLPPAQTGTAKGSPSIEEFFNDCLHKNGKVDGGGAKNDLTTSEFRGYTCDYLNKDFNKCWDYLSSSGSIYRGGETGCPKENVLGYIPAKPQAGKWDGTYSYNIKLHCSGDTILPPGFSFGGTITVTGNKAVDSKGGTFYINDLGGATEVLYFSRVSYAADGSPYLTFTTTKIFFAFFKQGGKNKFDAYSTTDAIIGSSKGDAYKSFCEGSTRGTEGSAEFPEEETPSQPGATTSPPPTTPATTPTTPTAVTPTPTAPTTPVVTTPPPAPTPPPDPFAGIYSVSYDISCVKNPKKGCGSDWGMVSTEKSYFAVGGNIVRDPTGAEGTVNASGDAQILRNSSSGSHQISYVTTLHFSEDGTVAGKMVSTNVGDGCTDTCTYTYKGKR